MLAVTADDIDFTGNLALSTDPGVKFGPLNDLVSTRFPSHAGRDKYFGYGRVNADQAVRTLSATTIPPEADIEIPGWFDNLDPTTISTVVICGLDGGVPACAGVQLRPRVRLRRRPGRCGVRAPGSRDRERLAGRGDHGWIRSVGS